MENPVHRPQVVWITETLSGGVRQHLHHLVPALRARGVALDLIVSTHRRDPETAADLAAWAAAGCRIDTVPMRRRPAPFADALAVARVRQRLRALEPEIVHCHATKAGLVGRLAARGLAGVRVLYSPHAFCFTGLPAGLYRRLALAYERAMARRTDRFVLVSAAEQQSAMAAAVADAARLCVIENGLPADFAAAALDRAAARQALGIPADALAVGVPGRLCRQKGQDWFLRAFAAVLPHVPNATAWLCGDGPAAHPLQRLAARLGVNAAVHWCRHVPDLAHRLRAFDLLVLPSRYEALAYGLLEGLAAGVPLVTSAIAAHRPRPALHEYLPAAPVDDVAALSGAVMRALTDVETAARVRDWAPAFVRREFSLERQTAQLAALYGEMAQPALPTGPPVATVAV